MVAGTLNFVTMRKAITLMFALCQVTQGSTFRCVWGGGRHGDGESREPAETRATQATMRLCEGGAQGGPPHWEKPDPMGKEVQLPPLTPSSPSCWLPLVSSYSFFKVQPQSPCLWEAEFNRCISGAVAALGAALSQFRFLFPCLSPLGSSEQGLALSRC